MNQATDRDKLSLIQRLAGAFKRYDVAPDPDLTTERMDVSLMDTRLFNLRPARLSKYKDYEEMDDEIVELSSALDIYADFITSSPAGEEALYNVEFEDEGRKREGAIVEDLEDRMGLKEKVWFITRNICKFGDVWNEIVIGGTTPMISKVKPLPSKEIFINRDNFGKQDPEWPWVQKDDMLAKVIAQFAAWELIHWKVGDDEYGVNYAVLGKLRRTYRILRMLEDSLLVTRIARANQRGVHEVDVTGMSAAEAAIYIKKLKLMNKRKSYISSTGKLKTEYDPLAPQEDVYVPVRKGGAGGGYSIVSGEHHLGEIRDVQHFHNKLFAGTKVPKAYLGFERDVNAKATLWQQHTAFVKVVRRYRHTLAEGLKKLYRTQFYLHQIDPAAFGWKIKFPSIGSADEELAWKIERIKAEVIGHYSKVGVTLPIEWIVRKLLMNLSSEERDKLIDQMGLNPDATTKAPPEPKPPAPDKGKEPKTPKDPDDEPDAEPEGGNNGGKNTLSETELADMLRAAEVHPRIQKLIKEVEEAVKAKKEGREYKSTEVY